MNVDVYTANEECVLTPKEAIGRHFISLGSQHHNYGKCYELICWINITDDVVENPSLSLIYRFEYKNCKMVSQVPIDFVILQLKTAINLLSNKVNKTTSMYRNYIILSSKRCLDCLLLDYSFYKYQEKMAKRIQTKWIYHYYNPNSKICIKIRTRQFMCLQEELIHIKNKHD
jgi:hypothetical protein